MPPLRLSGWNIVRLLVGVIVLLVLVKGPAPAPSLPPPPQYDEKFAAPAQPPPPLPVGEVANKMPAFPDYVPPPPEPAAIAVPVEEDAAGYVKTDQPSIEQAAAVEYTDTANMDVADFTQVHAEQEKLSNWHDGDAAIVKNKVLYDMTSTTTTTTQSSTSTSSTSKTSTTSTTSTTTSTTKSTSTQSTKQAVATKPAEQKKWVAPKPIDTVFPPPPAGQRGLVNVYLVNTPRYHFEVVLPILHSFSSLPYVNLTLFAGKSGYGRFGVGPLLERETLSYGLRMVDIVTLPKKKQPVPDYVFLTSCPEDINFIGGDITAWLEGGAKVQCLVHEPGRWDASTPGNTIYEKQIKYMRPWLEKGRWEMVVLSPHVGSFMTDMFPKYIGTSDKVKYNPPVIHPVFQPNAMDVALDSENPFAAIPGKYEEGRRNYQKIFRELQKFKPQVNLHLVGTGDDLKVPSEIKDRIIYVRDLEFTDYFEHLGKALMLIPAFATAAYTKNQASSTVATGMMVGTPLLADDAIVKAYSQIPLDAMWLQNPGETEIEALTRIMNMPKSAWTAKKARVIEVRDQMMADNLVYFESVLKKVYDERHGTVTVTATTAA